jgi:quinol monooxygenase YgiN
MRNSVFLASLLALMLAWGISRSDGTGATARADDEADQVVAVIHVDALPKFTAEGRALLRRYVADARKDEGAIRIEVFEELARPNHSTLVEVWRTRKAYDDHLGLDHTRTFRADLQPMLGSPFDERLHRKGP